MTDVRFLSADIDPAQRDNVVAIKERALHLIHQEIVADKQLHDDAAISILNDYEDMPIDTFLKQLRTYSHILNGLKHRDVFQEMLTLLSSLLRVGLHQVDGAALDAVTVKKDAVTIEIDGKSTIIGNVNGELLTILSIGKDIREVEKQLAAIDRLVKHPSDRNLHLVSNYLKIPFQETSQATQLIQQLFDDRGNFLRRSFDPMINELVRHGNYAFELLWCYFKALKRRANRVAFLNALQHLIGRIDRPKHALRFLLADFCRHSEEVDPSDRNAIMLANILLRSYNKELDVDIEMTPEEVLSVRNGLDLDVVHYAQFRIETVAHRFAAKIRTIHEKLIDRLNTPVVHRPMPSVRHLLFLEREILIFLSLLSGKTAHLILVAALTEYGDPKKGIYRNHGAATYLPVFLQHLKIIVRGVGRIGAREDVERLKQISEYGLALSEISGTPENQRSVIRTMEWIDNVIRSINASTLNPF